MAVTDGKFYYKSHVDSMQRISGPAKSMLDKQWTRMLVDHNLPSRMNRYENFRCFLNNVVIACGGTTLYAPPGNDVFLEENTNDYNNSMLAIKHKLTQAALEYGKLPFIVSQHDE